MTKVGVFLAKIVAIVNQKGGVGKTTTCVNLTSSLKEKGNRVLLCDFDPQANSTPMPEVELACGSKSHSRTRLPFSLREEVRLTQVVVLPTPPF